MLKKIALVKTLIDISVCSLKVVLAFAKTRAAAVSSATSAGIAFAIPHTQHFCSHF
jgi:hypothetical protein